jgi:hypothetical protein
VTSKIATIVRRRAKAALFAERTLQQDMAGQLVIIEHAADSEIAGSWLFRYAGHLTHAFDSNFFCTLARRWNQDFNSNICSNRWASAAENQRAVQCNISREAAIGLLRPVIPMEDHWQSQFVSHRSSTLDNEIWGHGSSQSRQPPDAQQDAERWECVGSAGSRRHFPFLYGSHELATSSATFQRTWPGPA